MEKIPSINRNNKITSSSEFTKQTEITIDGNDINRLNNSSTEPESTKSECVGGVCTVNWKPKRRPN